MNKATVKHPEHGDLEVAFDAINLPEGFSISDGQQQIPDGYVKQEVFDASVKDRLARQKKSLKGDAEYIREIIEANVPGIQYGEDGKPVLPKPAKEVDLDALRDQVIREIGDPLKSENDELKGFNQVLLDSKKSSDIMKASIKHGVSEQYLKPVSKAPNSPTFWENMIAANYSFAKDHGVFAVREGEGFALNPNGTREAPLLDIDSHIAMLKKDPAYSQFFKIEGQQGSGFSQNGGSVIGGKVTREAFSTGQISGDQLEKIANGTLRVTG